ncbi:MAG TPA: shikimate kinase [Candidatus Saccharimonadales bacterium]
MIVFINGSINSGKTTTGKALANKLSAEFVDVDDLNDRIPNFDLSKDIPKSIALAIDEINNLTSNGNTVVVAYPIRKEDHDQIIEGLNGKEIIFITLSPQLEISQSKRGNRELTEWEVNRIKYHYDTDISNPGFGEIIDNSDLSVDETVERIIDIVKL